MQYYSFQHRTLFPSSVTATTGCRFYFGSVSSFFLELFLHSSPVAYWASTDLGSSSFSVLYFCFFKIVHGVLKARILEWFAFPFSSGPRFVRTLHHDPSVLGHPCRATHLSISDLNYACSEEKLSPVFCEKNSD